MLRLLRRIFGVRSPSEEMLAPLAWDHDSMHAPERASVRIVGEPLWPPRHPYDHERP